MDREKEVMEYLNDYLLIKTFTSYGQYSVKRTVQAILRRYDLVEKDVEKLSDTIVRDRYQEEKKDENQEDYIPK